MNYFTNLQNIGPQWWGAIAGAAGAGAIVVPSHRIVAALAAGSLVAWLALGMPGVGTKAAAACCDDCAHGSSTPCSESAAAATDVVPAAPPRTLAQNLGWPTNPQKGCGR